MNTKRQTIWLVSMLSLMVVLSAYYLFTEDVSKLDLRTDKVAQEDVKVSSEIVTPDAAKSTDKAVSGATQQGTTQQGAKDSAAKTDSTAAKTDSSAKKDTAAKTDTVAKTDSKAAQQTQTTSAASAQSKDAQVLEKLQQQGKTASDFFALEEMKRNEELQKKSEQLLNIILDSKKTPDEVAKATDEMDKLQNKQAKVENLEDLLAKDFKSGAMVLEDASKWKVVVHSDKLEKSQAVSIIDLVMKELNVTQDKVTVQITR